jgi:phenylacetate-CoA ligase
MGARGSPLSLGIISEYLDSLRTYRVRLPELRELQAKRLRRQVAFAYERVPYYHEVMKAKSLLPSDFRDLNDLSKLPMLTKTIISSNQPKGLLARGVRILDTRRTSGTTGSPVTLYRGPSTNRRVVALRLRRMGMTGVRFWDKEIELPYWGSDVGAQSATSGPRVRRLMWSIPHLVAKPKDLVAGYRVLPLGPNNLSVVSRMILKYRPTILRSRPSYLRRLSRIIERLDPSFGVKTIFVGGEVLSNGVRQDLEASYHAQVFDEYGCAEFSGLGSECRFHSGIHLNSDYFIFELRAKDGEPAAEGERAEVIVTSLMDDAMPLIRYRIGDYAVKGSEDLCGCGSSLPRLRQVDGRASDGLVAANGDYIPPGIVVDLLETAIGLRDYQLVQENSDEVLIRVRSPLSQEMQRMLLDYLSGLLRQDVFLRTELWREDEMPVKFRAVMRSPSLGGLAAQVPGGRQRN